MKQQPASDIKDLFYIPALASFSIPLPFPSSLSPLPLSPFLLALLPLFPFTPLPLSPSPF